MPTINDLFPIEASDGSVVLSICNCRNGAGDPYHNANDLVLHMVIWGPPWNGGDGSIIRDVKEQRINVPANFPFWMDDWDFLFALKSVIADVLSTYDRVECLMPEDLFRPAWNALALKNRDFDKSLRMKSRLGKFLPAKPVERDDTEQFRHGSMFRP